MKSCELCPRPGTIEDLGHRYCPKHYVENTDVESLEMDLYQARNEADYPFEPAEEILTELKKKYPELAEKYKDVYEDYEA
ncbi:MAG: hypothetical protein ABIA93_04335 [Candidatus Woesearchaeota archaeon]